MQLSKVKGIGPKTIATLEKLNIFEVEDLASQLPVRYIDLSRTTDIKDFVVGDFVFCRLTLQEVKPLIKRGRLSFTIAYAMLEDTKIKLVWYNLPYVSKVLRKGATIAVYGKLSYDGVYTLINPQFERHNEIKNLQGVRAIYRTRGLIPQSTFGKLVREAINIAREDPNIDKATEEKFGLESFALSMTYAHMPPTYAAALAAKRRILIDRAVGLIRQYKAVRASIPYDKRHLYDRPFVDMKKGVDTLPFTLHQSQKDALKSILSGLKSAKPLNAMLQGDVGSGKTAVALLSAYFVSLCGYQTAFLVPTTILAAQHYATAKQLLGDCLKVEMLTSATPLKKRQQILDDLSSGRIDVLIGTQSILSEKITWKNISFVIIDEQQKFGIKDREALHIACKDLDTLSLTATPIPRSLGLVYFGGTDVYYLDEREPRNILTYVVDSTKRANMIDYIVKKVENGEKAFIVAPAIMDIEGIEMSGVDNIFDILKERLCDKVSCLHGKLKEDEKLRIMTDFRDGSLNLVVATSVVEVGVDIPEASYLIIMHADRFGLSTLHQIRGRIGRLGQKSECFLYTEAGGDSFDRLKKFSKMTSGAEVAEEDFATRGGGELLGLRQSGVDKALEGLTVRDLKLCAKIEEVVVR